jgi:hypothetical protein
MKYIPMFFVLLLLIGSSDTSGQQIPNDLSTLTQIRSGIKSKRISSYDQTGKNDDRFAGIKPGTKKVLFDVKGSGIINHIWITIAPDNFRRDDIVLRMYWDGNTQPSVETPLGSFFGQGWNEYYPMLSQPLIASPDNSKGLVSYFHMPFAKGARIEIENQSESAIDAFYYYVDYYEVQSLAADVGRFHAWYNLELTESDSVERENEWGTLGETKANKTGKSNYLIADIKGKGHFIGVNYYVHSPTPLWYGEGDDMIFIDGSETPTLHGTGTEDYFNTSWCPKQVFHHPYFGYPRVNISDRQWEFGWLGRTHVYRFNIPDPIYFEKSMRFTIEHGHNNVLTLDLRSVAYWYQSQAVGVPAITPRKEREPMHTVNNVDIHKWRDAWRRSRGNEGNLWGNEEDPRKKTN